MNVAAMIGEIRDHEFDDLSDERLIEFLNDQYQDICSRYPWPFLLSIVTDLSSDENGVLAFPEDMNKMKTMYLTSDKYRMNLLDDDVFFFEKGGVVELKGPSRYIDQPLTLEYYMVPPALADKSDVPLIPPKHHRAIVLGALARCYYLQDDTALGQQFERQFEERVVRMSADLLKRDMAPRRVKDVYAE